MTKTQFYNDYILPYIVIGDKPHNRQLWNDTLDSMLKDGTLQANAECWIYPENNYFV